MIKISYKARGDPRWFIIKHIKGYRNQYPCVRTTKRDRIQYVHPQKHPHSDFHSVLWNRRFELYLLNSLGTRLCDQKSVVLDCSRPGAPTIRFWWCLVKSWFWSKNTRSDRTGRFGAILMAPSWSAGRIPPTRRLWGHMSRHPRISKKTTEAQTQGETYIFRRGSRSYFSFLLRGLKSFSRSGDPKTAQISMQLSNTSTWTLFSRQVFLDFFKLDRKVPLDKN